MKVNIYPLFFLTFINSLPLLNSGDICVTQNDCNTLLTCNQNICVVLNQIVVEYLGYNITTTTDTPTSTDMPMTDTPTLTDMPTTDTPTSTDMPTGDIPMQTDTSTPTLTCSCNWDGHCLGDVCTTENDCDGNLVCNSGVCTADQMTSTVDTSTTNTPTNITLPINSTQGTNVIDNVYISFYGFDDNDNGSGTFGVSTISNPMIHTVATESTGTYDSPSTFASDQLFRVFNAGDIIYIPKFRKYYILEDTCVECTSDQNNGNIHIDLYIGGNTKLEGTTLRDCEYSLDTGGFNTVVIKNPSNDLPVDTVVLYDESTQVCNTKIF